MIVFDLSCAGGHRFEGWFSSSEDFAAQQARGMVCCPDCGSGEIAKAPMAPAVPKKGNQRADPAGDAPAPVANRMPPDVAEAMAQLATMQAEALKQSTWVGDKFAEHSRAMHYGEKAERVIHGKATPKEAKALLEEGIPVAPLPFPVSPPDELN
jgi:hypothetical protein